MYTRLSLFVPVEINYTSRTDIQERQDGPLACEGRGRSGTVESPKLATLAVSGT